MAKRRQHLAIRAATGLGKGLWWVTKGAAKLGYEGAKLAAKGAVGGAKLAATGAGWTVSKVKEGQDRSRAAKENRPATKEPAVYAALEQVETVKGNLEHFEERLDSESLIIAIVGKRGSGKSVLGFRLLENIHAKSKRPMYAMGVPQKVLPEWIKSIAGIEEVKNHGVVLVDEGAVEFGARESMSEKNRMLTQLMAVARHKDLTLVLITQNTALIDKNVLRLCDAVVFKEGSLLQERMERSSLLDLYKTAGELFERLPRDERKRHSYVVDSDFEGMVSASVPSFWTSAVSKSRA